MARQKGIIRLDGSAGGLSFFKSNGKYMARGKGGPSKHQIKTWKSMARTRENNMEFGGASIMAAAIRRALAAMHVNFTCDIHLSQRLNAVSRKISNASSWGLRGERPFLLSEMKSRLNGFEFNQKNLMKEVLVSPKQLSHDASRTSGNILLPGFDAQKQLKPATGATHYALVSLVGVVGDHVYHPEIKGYLEEVPVPLGLRGKASTGLMGLDTGIGDVYLEAQLPAGTAVHGSWSVVQTLGVLFYQELSGEHYLLKGVNAMQVVQVF